MKPLTQDAEATDIPSARRFPSISAPLHLYTAVITRRHSNELLNAIKEASASAVSLDVRIIAHRYQRNLPHRNQCISCQRSCFNFRLPQTIEIALYKSTHIVFVEPHIKVLM